MARLGRAQPIQPRIPRPFGAPASMSTTTGTVTFMGAATAGVNASANGTVTFTGTAAVQTVVTLWKNNTPAWCAHRGGFYDTYGEFTVAGFNALKAWNKKVAWNIDVVKTTDGEWVASHDLTTGRVLSGTSLDITASAWSAISSKTTLVGGNPVARLDDLVAIAPAGTVFFVDNKANTNQSAFFTKLAALGLTTANTVVKNYVGSAANNTSARSNGFQLWIYGFDGDTSSFASNTAAGDWVGFDYAGTQANWNTIIGLGLPSFAHILTSTTDKATADSKAATAGGSNFGYMVANVAAVVPMTEASASGTITAAGSVTGQASASAAGAVAFAGSTTGRAAASTAGTFALAGNGTAGSAATAAGAVTATGTATAGGTANTTGTVTFTGAATGAAPAIGSGAVTFTGAATGQASATSAGTVTFGGSALPGGSSPGNATGSLTITGTATAAASAYAAAATTVAGTASAGAATSAAGTITAAGTGTAGAATTTNGIITFTGGALAGGGASATATGSLTFTGTAAVTGASTAAGTITVSGTVTAAVLAAAAGQAALTGLAAPAGQASAAGALIYTGTASGHDSAALPTAPAEQTLHVALDNRTMTVPLDDRTLTVRR